MNNLASKSLIYNTKSHHVRVHLNAIGRPYNKEPNQWLKSEPAKEYVDAVELLDKQTDSDPLAQISSKRALSVHNVDGLKAPAISISEAGFHQVANK